MRAREMSIMLLHATLRTFNEKKFDQQAEKEVKTDTEDKNGKAFYE